MNRLAWFQSLSLHVGLLAAALLIYGIQKLPQRQTQKINLDVIVAPKLESRALNIKEPVKKSDTPLPEPKRAVFGVSRKAIVAEGAAADSAPAIKLGNTVAKQEDNLVLSKDDVDQLPIPADEFMITSMPRIKSEYRIQYPAEAKKAGVEGPVVMELLIDATGRVRKVDLVSGPGFGLNEAAVTAVQKFEFLPGRIQNDAVAVRIRYTYRFVLEGS